MNKDLKYYLIKYLIIILGLILPIILIIIMNLLNLPEIINSILSLIFIIIIPLTFFKIFKDYIKCGTKIFKLKSNNNCSEIEFLTKDIERIDAYQKIIVKDNKIIVINKAGVFEFILFDKKGFLKGNIKDEFWYLDDEKIKNPFTIKSEYKYNYFIVNGLCLFKTDVKLLSKANIYYEIIKCLNKEVYRNEKIDEIYEVLNGNN